MEVNKQRIDELTGWQSNKIQFVLRLEEVAIYDSTKLDYFLGLDADQMMGHAITSAHIANHFIRRIMKGAE